MGGRWRDEQLEVVVVVRWPHCQVGKWLGWRRGEILTLGNKRLQSGPNGGNKEATEAVRGLGIKSGDAESVFAAGDPSSLCYAK